MDIRKTPFVVLPCSGTGKLGWTGSACQALQAKPADFYRMAQQQSSYPDILAKVFYHEKNIILIQKKLIKEIFKQTGGEYLIPPQATDDIKTVMQSIFSQYQPLNLSIKEQIKQLDQEVVDAIIPTILSEIDGYTTYLRDRFGPRQILPYPQYQAPR